MRAYVASQYDWEAYLPPVLYAYRTSQHSSTGVSPFLLLYGRHPTPCPLATQLGYDTLSYPAQIQVKLAELQDFVHSNLTQAAHSQKCYYDQHAKQHTFNPGDPVWLSIPTARKLDPKWEGEWVIQSVKSPVTVEICRGTRTKVVHINRLQRRYVPGTQDAVVNDTEINHEIPEWPPPSVDHVILPSAQQTETFRYPQRHQRPPDRYGP